MTSRLTDIKLEIDYGMQYLLKACTEKDGLLPNNLATAYERMFEAKELIGSYIMKVSRYNDYWESDNSGSLHIESSLDTNDPDDVNIYARYDKVKHIKFMREGTKSIRCKLQAITNKPLEADAGHFITGAVISLEIAYIWLRQELLLIKEKAPERHSKPSTKEEIEVSRTEELINKRLE